MSLLKRPFVIIIIIVGPFFLSNSLFSREITVLPAMISGVIPPEFGSETEAEIEISRLTRHFLRKNFFTELTDGRLIETKWSESQEKIGVDSTKNNSGLCLEWDSHFIVQDQIDFGSASIVKTNIHNCRSGSTQIIQSKLVSQFVFAYEKHIEKSFRFLPPKQVQKRPNQNNNHEIFFFLDIHSSYAYYKKDFVSAIHSLADRSGLYLGLVYVKKDKAEFLTPSVEHQEIKNRIQDVNWQGSNQAETILSAVSSLKNKITSGKKESRKFIFLFSSGVKSKASQLILALNDLRQSGIEPLILVPNHTDLPTIREIQRIGRASGSKIIGITEFQKIGTPDGYENLYLNQFTLYSSIEPQSPPFDWKSSVFKSFDASLVRAAVNIVTPYNMHEAYSKITEKRILEKDEVATDILSIIESETTVNMIDKDRYQSVLLQANGEAIWITLPIEMNVPTGKPVVIQTTFLLDPLSGNGVRNIPYESQILKITQTYPKLLSLVPTKIKKIMELNKQMEINGYISGTVTLVKKR